MERYLQVRPGHLNSTGHGGAGLPNSSQRPFRPTNSGPAWHAGPFNTHMTRLKELPEIQVIKGFKGKVDFYLWKGIAVARRWPRKTTIPKTPAEQASANEFGAISASYKLTDPITRDALAGMVASSQERQLDMYIALSLGHRLDNEPFPYYFAPEGESMLTAYHWTSNFPGSVTVQINTTNWQQAGGRRGNIDWDKITYTRYRVTSWGTSNAPGQHIDIRIVHDIAGSPPFGDGTPDLTITNSNQYWDSGVKTLLNPAFVFQDLQIQMRGSNSAVDFNCEMLEVVLWQE